MLGRQPEDTPTHPPRGTAQAGQGREVCFCVITSARAEPDQLEKLNNQDYGAAMAADGDVHTSPHVRPHGCHSSPCCQAQVAWPQGRSTLLTLQQPLGCTKQPFQRLTGKGRRGPLSRPCPHLGGAGWLSLIQATQPEHHQTGSRRRTADACQSFYHPH